MHRGQAKSLIALFDEHGAQLDNIAADLRENCEENELKFYLGKIAHILAIQNDICDRIASEHPELLSKTNTRID